MPSRQHRLIIDAVLLGIVGALSSELFMWMLRAAQYAFLNVLAGYNPPGLPEEGGTLREVVGANGLWLIPLATTLGGLAAGMLVFKFAPEAEGHGTDTAVRAFHRSGGLIRFRVPPLKMIASAITIGSGGAAGREGPTALITAGLGSAYATLTRRTEEDRRMLVLIGMAAGLAAIFRSPIGAAVFAVEVLYWSMEFEAYALLFTMLASIVAYSVNGLYFGWEPLFNFPQQGGGYVGLLDHGWYAVLGIAAGVVAAILPEVFYRVRDLFRWLPVPVHFKPAVGGLGLGLLALAVPQVLGGGYGWIQEAMDGRLSGSLLGTLLLAKIIALSLTISSGGSGGVFAPSLFVGGMLGGWLASMFDLPPASFVVVGMGAVFAGAARVPLATLLMVTEMTGGYELLVPAAMAVVLSTLVQAVLASPLKYRSLYEAQVSTRADSPAHHVEHLQVALNLLRQRKIPAGVTLGHVDLVQLLESGIPLALPGGRELGIGVLRAGSPWIDRPPPSSSSADENGAADVVAVLRENELLLPGPELRLQAGDQLLAIGSSDDWQRLRSHLVPLGEEEDSRQNQAAPSIG